MILQRLCEAAAHFTFPPPGYQEGPVKWLIDLDQDGHYVNAVETSETDRPNDRGKRMYHPYVLRTSGARAQLLADRASYALGRVAEGASTRQIERTGRCHALFLDLVSRCAEETGYGPVAAVLAFLRSGLSDAHLPEELQPEHVVTFRVGGDLLIDRPQVRRFWRDVTGASRQERAQETLVCPICGERKPMADGVPLAIKPVPGGQTSGTFIVSINAAAFESYGRKGSSSSPLCWDCAQTHAQVANAMLADDHYHLRIHDRVVYIFWTREHREFSAASFLSQPDPADVRRLLESVYKGGADAVQELDAFYALALSGSGARVVVRDWAETTVGRVKRHLARYFGAQEIVGPWGEPGAPLGLYALLAALVPSTGRNPWSQLSPNLIRGLVRTAILGTPLPEGLLHAAVARARLEQGMTRPRAAIIKMSLLLSTHREEGFDVKQELNSEAQQPAYLCGRLFAVLESIQRAAVPGAKATIVDRYYGTASSAPASVFGNLIRQAQAHLGKLRKTREGAYFALQRALEDVAGGLPDFPRTLTLIDQGKFGLGYYQQRAADRAARMEAVAAKQAEEQEDDESQEEEE